MPTWSVGAKLRNKEPERESETFHAEIGFRDNFHGLGIVKFAQFFLKI